MTQHRPFRLLISGTRDATDAHRYTIETTLHRYLPPITRTSPIILIHGDAPGVDWICASLASLAGWTTEPHPADWKTHTDQCPTSRAHHTDTYCTLAGRRRNAAMVALGADLTIAFPAIGTEGHSGTWNLIHLAADADITVITRSLGNIHHGRSRAAATKKTQMALPI